MPLSAKKNQYIGVNAHANSILQNEPGEWVSFHAEHIVDITRALNEALPPGYEARTERSLQIKEIFVDPDGEQTTSTRKYPQPDATAFDTDRTRERSHSPSPAGAADLVMAVIDTMDMGEDELNASVIYEISEGDRFGRPVTRIELLSPTNKPGEGGYEGEGYKQYRDKRNATLQSGMPLVEIDYLHQQPSVIKKLDPYPQAAGSHPYSIIVSDPRPSIHEGKTHLHAFDVDVPIPCTDIPLDHGQKVAQFDLGAVYNRTFGQNPTLQRIVDYEAAPEKFASYSGGDQERIKARMLMVKAMREAGKDLDTDGPFAIDPGVVKGQA